MLPCRTLSIWKQKQYYELPHHSTSMKHYKNHFSDDYLATDSSLLFLSFFFYSDQLPSTINSLTVIFQLRNQILRQKRVKLNLFIFLIDSHQS